MLEKNVCKDLQLSNRHFVRVGRLLKKFFDFEELEKNGGEPCEKLGGSPKRPPTQRRITIPLLRKRKGAPPRTRK